MTPADELKVMQSFYDRIFQMVTYSPDQGPAAGASSFGVNTTLVQLVTDGSLNFKDYQNMVTPVNTRGNLGASEAFYRLINSTGGIGSTFSARNDDVGDKYKQIVNGANASVKPTTQQQNQYNNVRSYLYQVVTATDPVTGNPTSTAMPTANYRNYQTYQTLYIGALSAYRSAYLTYNMQNPEDQRKWMALSPVLQNNLDSAWQNWVSLGDKSAVEEALNFLAASDNNIVANLIADGQQTMKQSALNSVTGSGTWYLSYASPFTWCDDSETAGWMNFTLNSNYLYTSDNSYYQKTQGSAGSSFLGLISWGGSGGSSTQQTSHHMEGDNLAISCAMITVTVERPWMDDALFQSQGWSELGQPKNWISDGTLNGDNANAFLPVVPTALVIVKNVSITANWSTQDSQSLTTAVQGGGGFSFGPFHSGGSSSSGSSSSSSSSTFTGGTLSIPDPQIVARVSSITPASPPQQG